MTDAKKIQQIIADLEALNQADINFIFDCLEKRKVDLENSAKPHGCRAKGR